MLTYNTGTAATPPISDDMRASALRGLTAQYGGQGDLYRSLAQQNAVAVDRAAQDANADFLSRARDAQSQMAQRGMQQMAQYRQQDSDLARRQLQDTFGRVNNAYGMVNSVLSGLF